MAAPSAFVCSGVRYFTKIMLLPACLIMSVGREAGIDGGVQGWECRKKKRRSRVVVGWVIESPIRPEKG